MALLKSLYNSIQEDFGIPVTIQNLLAGHPEIAAPFESTPESIALEDIVEWHEWCHRPVDTYSTRNPNSIMGWRYDSYEYRSFYVEREEFSHFGTRQITENWVCDIQDVKGLACSKSNLVDFTDLDEMAETKCRGLIEPINHENLRENLAWPEIRVLNGRNSDYFVSHRWDGRLFLVNSGGSHHFAAARYLASRLGVSVPLQGKLYTYGINPDAVASLRRDFEIFAVSKSPEIFLGFREAMQRFRATYLWQYLPRPYHERHAILLPKAEPRSVKVAATLKAAGVMDLGRYLQDLADRQ